MPDTNYDHNQRFGHANARNSNLYLNIICVKLVTQVKKKKLKNKLKFGLLTSSFKVFKKPLKNP